MSLRRLVRPLLVASIGTVLAGVTVWSTAGMVAMGNSHAMGPRTLLPAPLVDPTRPMQARAPVAYVSIDKAARLSASSQPIVAANITAGLGNSARRPDVAKVVASGDAARFDAVMTKAGLTSKKLARLFSHAATSQLATATVAAPAPERRASLAAAATDQPHTALAYADPSPGGAAGNALSALLTAPSEEDLAASQQEDTASLPVYEDTPSDGPLPQIRPRGDEGETPKPKVLAYARPDGAEENKISGKLGQSLRNLLGGKTRAGNGVAVYDISAAKVYMPDGSVLEAHSGIGKMADNPRYVHVEMNGPTPPHTYNLKMRESRFHGVEAIRMLPVDGKNKFGRDGFLTHSYLLRGGRAESHGCVAFKDYNRFLNAFKQGKVKQIVVVPNGGSDSFRLASNGKSV